MMALLTREAPSESLVRRRQILSEIAELQKQSQALDDLAKQQRQRVLAAGEALETAKLELVAAEKKATGHATVSSHRSGTLTAELLTTAPPEIDETIARLQGEAEQYRDLAQTQTSHNARGLVFTSNVPAIEKHRSQVYEAVRSLNELKRQAPSDRELAREIKRIAASVTPPDTTIREVKR